MSLLKVIFFIFLLNLQLFASEYEQEKSDYNLGEGFQVGSLPLYLGGYISTEFREKAGENRYRLDDIAMLAYGSYNKLSYMAEIEYKEFYTLVTKDDNSTVFTDTRLHIERVYIDYTFNESYMLRLGKYNSPIGFWNLIPINVLRDTSSIPISLEVLFPRFTTGAQLSYNSFKENEWQVDILLQKNKDVDANYNNFEIDEHYALGITYIHEDLSLKLNLGVFNNITTPLLSDYRAYFLTSLEYQTNKFRITSEIGTQRSKEKFVTKYAGYVQAAYYFLPKHTAILRLEAYERSNINIQNEMVIFGYTYRPLYPIAFKTEYKVDSLNMENQFLFSFSVLF